MTTPPPGDRLAALLHEAHRTRAHYDVAPDYLRTVQRHGMTQGWRGSVWAWYLEVSSFGPLAQSCHIDVVPTVALSFLDRYLSKHSCNQHTFRLVAFCALLVALKVHGASVGKGAHAVRILLNGSHTFTLPEIKMMEKHLLVELDWHLSPVTLPQLVRAVADCVATVPECVNKQMRLFTSLVAADFSLQRFPATMLACGVVQFMLEARRSAAAAVGALSAHPVVRELMATHDPEQAQICVGLLRRTLANATPDVPDTPPPAAAAEEAHEMPSTPVVGQALPKPRAHSPDSVVDGCLRRPRDATSPFVAPLAKRARVLGDDAARSATP